MRSEIFENFFFINKLWTTEQELELERAAILTTWSRAKMERLHNTAYRYLFSMCCMINLRAFNNQILHIFIYIGCKFLRNNLPYYLDTF